MLEIIDIEGYNIKYNEYIEDGEAYYLQLIELIKLQDILQNQVLERIISEHIND